MSGYFSQIGSVTLGAVLGAGVGCAAGIGANLLAGEPELADSVAMSEANAETASDKDALLQEFLKTQEPACPLCAGYEEKEAAEVAAAGAIVPDVAAQVVDYRGPAMAMGGIAGGTYAVVRSGSKV